MLPKEKFDIWDTYNNTPSLLSQNISHFLGIRFPSLFCYNLDTSSLNISTNDFDKAKLIAFHLEFFFLISLTHGEHIIPTKM